MRSPEDYVKYATISVISSSGANILNYFYVKKYCDIKFTNNIDWKVHYKPILLLFVLLLAQQAFNNIDVTMLGLIKGDYEVGLYTTATKVTNIIGQISGSLLWVIMPQLSVSFASENYETINNILRKAFNALVTIGFPCAIGTICLAKQIILLIGGESYLGATNSLIILMLYHLISTFGGSFLGNMVMLPNGGEKQFMKIFIFMAVFDSVANYFLIPVYGATGASFATMLSALVALPMFFVGRDKRIKLKPLLNELLAPTIGCLAIFIICFITTRTISSTIVCSVTSIILSAIVYFIVQILLKNELITNTFTTFKNKLIRNK